MNSSNFVAYVANDDKLLLAVYLWTPFFKNFYYSSTVFEVRYLLIHYRFLEL